MGTNVRPEVSEKNDYWIDKYRYYELKYFCFQYGVWKKAYSALDSLSKRPSDLEAMFRTNTVSDPVAKCAEARECYLEISPSKG